MCSSLFSEGGKEEQEEATRERTMGMAVSVALRPLVVVLDVLIKAMEVKAGDEKWYSSFPSLLWLSPPFMW